jgi:pilus assembly protein Flp/PilA
MALLKKMWSDDFGQGMVEYGLIIGLIVAVVVAAVALLGPNINSLFNAAGNKASAAIS